MTSFCLTMKQIGTFRSEERFPSIRYIRHPRNQRIRPGRIFFIPSLVSLLAICSCSWPRTRILKENAAETSDAFDKSHLADAAVVSRRIVLHYLRVRPLLIAIFKVESRLARYARALSYFTPFSSRATCQLARLQRMRANESILHRLGRRMSNPLARKCAPKNGNLLRGCV